MRTNGWLSAVGHVISGRDGRPLQKPDGSHRRQGVLALSAFLVAVSLSILLGVGSNEAQGDEAHAAAGPAAEQKRAADETSSSEIPVGPPIGGPQEIASKRTATSDTFLLPDGERETRIYQAPINYRNPQGEWVPITEGFKRAGLAIEDRSHPFEIHLPSAMGNGPVRFGGADHWISFELEGSETAPAELESGGTVSYEIQGSETSLEYSTLPDGIKETIELAGPSSPATIHYRLSAANGITPGLTKDESIDFREEAGNVIAVIPAPTVSDRSSPRPEPGHASFALSSKGEGIWSLSVQVDPSWLEAPGRTWPVKIDPTLLTAEGQIPSVCGIFNTSPNASECIKQGWMYAIANSRTTPPDLIHRTLLGIGLAGVPSSAEIHEANVGLYDPYAVTNISGVELRRVVTAWDPSTATWECASWQGGCHLWATQGGDFNAEGSEVTTAQRGSQAGWWIFSKGLASVFQGWLTGTTPNDGLILKLADEGKHECTGSVCVERGAGWYSTGSTEVAYRPYIKVVYLPKAPTSSQISLPAEGTTTARRLRLKAKWKEEGSVNGVTFEYRTNPKEKGTFKPIPPELVHQANGEPINEWPIHSSLFEAEKFQTQTLYFDAAHVASKLQEEGGPIDIRAVFDGTPAVEGFSEPNEVVVNRITGSAHDATTGVGPGTLDLETGNLSIARTDVSIPGFKSGLEFGRTYNSRAPHPVTESEKAEPPSVLGTGWKTNIPVEEAGGSEYRNVRMVVHSGEYEEQVGEACEEVEVGEEEFEEKCTPEFVKVPYRYAWAIVTPSEGGELPFEEGAGGTFNTPPELSGWKLVKNTEGNFVLSDPYGDITTFKPVGGGEEQLPFSISQPGGGGNSTRLEWRYKNGEKQLTELIGPSAPGLECVEVTVTSPTGCHALEFTYAPVGSSGERLIAIKYLAPGNLDSAPEVAHYEYNSVGQLVAEWDPRISPPLKEQYAYEANGQLKEVTPPGQKPWTLEYGTVDKEAGVGRLTKVRRASLLASPTEAQTTIAYNVPLTTVNGPYEMGGKEVAQWGQADIPVEATAIFPPSEVPTASPPTSWAQATIYYLDSEGYAVNTATPRGGGTSEPSISTAEADEYGNTVRELTPANRLVVMGEPESKRREKWEALQTTRRYTEQGTQMVEELGPMHTVRIAATGEGAEARLKTVVEYDKCLEGQPCWSGVKPHMPTLETTYASNPNWGVKDERRTETQYNWNLRQQTKTIVDPGTGHLNITSDIGYEEASGLPTLAQMPKEQTSEGAAGKGAGTTRTVYYGLGISENEACRSRKYIGLPCKVEPVAQTEGTGRPKLLVKWITGYNAWAEPTEVIESPGGSEVKAEQRITKIEYDAAGRQLRTNIEGGGTQSPETETVYSPTLGLPTEQRLVCEKECTTGFHSSSSFGSTGSGSGQFAHPGDVALDPKGDLWVTDAENNRLEEFSESGKFLKSIGSQGTGNGQFNRPESIAFTAAGNLWVVDANNDRLQEFNEKGEFLKAVGSEGSGNGQFKRPEHLAIDAKGNIWVSDTYDGRIEELNEKGEFIKVVNPSGLGAIEPTGIAVGPGGNVWVTDWAHNRVVEISGSGETLVRKLGTEGSANGQFRHPDAVTIDPAGHVWVVDEGNQRVQEFDQEGKYLGQFGSPGAGPGQFSLAYPTGIAADGKGDVWVTDPNDNRVERWVPGSFDSQATTTTYNALGQVSEYEDADNNKTEFHYDIDGRPTAISDNKGTQTYHYNETSGLLTSLEDSSAGTFTATYDANGNLIESGLPNGVTAKTSYNVAGEPTKLAYTKTSSCGESCTWYEESVERSIYGQILTDGNSLATDRYKYDNAGRLTEAQETPVGGGCTTREYKYDADSNRLSRTVRGPGVGGACVTSGGTPQNYSYDAADRLLGTGLTYDGMGRITNLPAEYAGGKALETKFFASNMVATQTQSGVTNSYELDASGRQRQRIQAGGVAGTEIFHYDSPGDSPAWSALGSTWTRNIPGIGGELAAVQQSDGTMTFELTDLHGDVVATASPSLSATKLLATFRFDEFGEPMSGNSGRFGWLGGKQRRTELSSGVIQMGARSYVPSLGRFLSPDPVPGACANPYEYAGQDPVNGFDILGSRCHDIKGHHLCFGKKERRELHRALLKVRQEAASEHVAEMHVTCVGKAGCYVSQNSGGGGSGLNLSALGAKLVKLATERLTNPVSSYGLIGDAIREAVKPVIEEALGGEKSRLSTCLHEIISGAEQFGGIVAGAAETTKQARLGVAVYAAGKCAQAILSP